MANHLGLHADVVRTMENCRMCPLTCLKGGDCYFPKP